MSSPLIQITARRVRGTTINVWAFSTARKKLKHPTYVFDGTITDANAQAIKATLQLPVTPWYWRVRVRWVKRWVKKGIAKPFRQATVRRIARKPDDEARYLFDEAFEVWCSYARML